MNNATFWLEIESAKKEIRVRKKTTPYLFVEYIKMKQAECELITAQENFKLAKIAWNKLGK